MSPESEDAQGDQWLAFGEREKCAVLIVDDEPQLVTAMTDALDEQYRVIGETSPQNALDVLKKNPDVHVIISDQRMPGMSGDEFLFRAQQISPATRILATAYADLGAVISAVNNGKIFNYIRKPWSETELRSIVDTAAQHFTLGAALLRERALLKCIMDCSLDAISVKNIDHHYIRLNGPEAAMLGANSPAQVNGRSHGEFLSPSRAACWSGEEERLLETHEPLRDRVEHVVGDDGSERWYATTKTPIRSSAGAAIGLVSVTRDITENKSVEHLKDDFIAMVRHELRTPLTVIMSAIKLTRTGRFGELTAKIDELLSRGEVNCDRLLGLINNMLDIQDITTGKAGLKMAPIALPDFIDECRKLGEPLAQANEIELRIDATLPDVTIMGDRKRLLQALCHLLSNACRFSPRQTAIKIAVLEQLDHMQISVIDQGPGVPIAVVDKLFRSFSQLDSSANRFHEGAGLGLRICKAIAEAHSGRIGCMPAPGGGANFFLLLPRMLAQ